MPVPLKTSPWGPDVFPPEWTLSAWQRSVRGDPLTNWGENDLLPETADVVIIGSGISGGTISRGLLNSPDRPGSVVVLEAREISSGASGRNAGHCRPDAFRGYNIYKRLHGAEQAKKILESEAITFERRSSVKAFVEENNIDCEWTYRPTLDLCLSEDFVGYAKQAFEDAKAGGVDVSNIKVLDKEAARKAGRIERAQWGYQWKAATLNPIKLAYALYRKCLEYSGFSLFAYTPATSVTPNEGDTKHPWLVSTPRGTIKASKVVHATNGYAKLLLPEMEDYIWTYKAQAVQLEPPPLGIESFPKIEPSLSLRYDLQYYYSVAQRPSNHIVLALPRTCAQYSYEDYEKLFGDMNDRYPDPVRAKDAFDHFQLAWPEAGYGNTECVEGKGGFDYTWAGILGFTPDQVPFVGAIPGKDGQYIMAGFNGHGMARMFHCGPCLADVIIKGPEAWHESVPTAFAITEERLKKLAAWMPKGVSMARKADATAFAR